MSDIENRIYRLLHSIAKEQNCVNYELNLSSLSSSGANYSSLLYVATIRSEGRNDLNLFVKVAAMSEAMREQVSTSIYETEKVVYTDVKQIYSKIETKHQVPEEHRLYLPKYYGAISTPLEEVLVLENMAAKGFVTYDRFKSIDWEYAAKAVTELAKLHSLSIAFQTEYPEEFKKLNDRIVDLVTEDVLGKFWVNGAKIALEVLTGENKRKFKDFVDKTDFPALKKQYVPLKVKVITHGDFRPSNLMHRRRDNGNLELVVVDHQTIQIGSPVIDLIYFIVCGTDKEFRATYYEKLIDFYYTQLSDAMKRLSIDPEKTYSRDDYDFELKEKLPHGLIVATFVLQFVTVDTDKAPEVSGDKDFECLKLTEIGTLYPKRINDIVSDFSRWGVLAE